MSAQIIDGTAIATAIKDEVRDHTAVLLERYSVRPGLAFLLVGDNPASMSYVRSKEKACAYCGFHSTTLRLPESVSERDVLEQIDTWNIDPDIHGILVQLPLPPHIDEQKVIEAISPKKDVDGFHPKNVGRLLIGIETLRPCTPAGIQELLVRSNTPISGAHVVVVGRSNIVGKPVAAILVQKASDANAVVTIVHSGSTDIARFTRQADILIAAMGKPGAITGDMIKDGVVIIDVGINQVEDPTTSKGYRLVGDVDMDSVREKAAAITPVPGGVGPMTIAMLMRNTLLATERSLAGRG